MNFHDFQNKVVQLFKSEQDELSPQFANVSFSIGNHGNEPNGYLSLSALFTEASLDDPDLLELVISINTLNPSTKINADVCWGHPSGHVEACCFSQETG